MHLNGCAFLKKHESQDSPAVQISLQSVVDRRGGGVFKKLFDSNLCIWLIPSDTRNTKQSIMRTKTLLLSAAVGVAGLMAASAQTVYSVNSVGYINLTIPNGFSMVVNQLDAGDNSVGALFPAAPLGTTIYKWDIGTSDYVVNTFSFAGWGDPAMTMNPGEGAFIKNTSGADINITLVGEVPQGAESNSSISDGFSIIGSVVPQSGALDADLSFPVTIGDTFYLFDTGTQDYVIYTYSFAGFGGNPPVPNVGEAFFVKKNGAATWTRDFSVNN